MTERLSGIVLLLLAISYGIGAQQLRITFVSDPLGARAFPLLLAILLGILSLPLIIRPGPEADWPKGELLGRLVIASLAVIAFALLFEPFGFIPAGILLASVLAVLSGGSPIKGVGIAVFATLSVFVLFRYVLGLQLPPFGFLLGA